ncbi:AmmeMemoRadiSam system radical SAM enzyme [Opitutus sp. ER46]|uniref:AmmeMemoRadiSam system radical SAM enzyme n=1 Tax=Opitutus sp. ER46 TaxID=2161864 RepID=UPI001304A81B|nr:AmmeMemoRadiSam system radical SAM enzyme [Opitutus sp. ER46]
MSFAIASAPVSRRTALRAGGATALLAATDASWLQRLLGLGADGDGPAEVFKGDAPGEATWRRWAQRGWAREAAHYVKLGRNVQCKVCPNNCILAPGDRSHCRNKVNRDGTLYTLAYGNPCTFHVDPVEKKPLFHFHPGARTFSLATAGCVFRCLNCQNWEISQRRPEDTKDARGAELRLRAPLPATLTLDEMSRLSLFPEDLPGVAEALRCPSVSYTYSEPTAYYEYTLASCRAVRAAGRQNILVSCGSIEERPLRELLAFVDAAHIDLKGFDESTYRQLNSGRLAPILRTLKVCHELGVWFEIINLVVPGYTDRLDSIRRMCGWIVAELGPDRPLHFSRFHPQHKLEHLAPTPVDTLLRARDIARDAGLRHVYIGNVPELEGAEATFCPQCRRPVIERTGFAVTRNVLVGGRCPHCQTAVAGVW